ncbi:MAG: DUF4097 family beta strand repeat-containing protein [Candidatus Wallbacteria bacterium]|nr:DUF4097 family beta strand repeat-containing protein [Candidatus Wallbacteria bacterium]
MKKTVIILVIVTIFSWVAGAAFTSLAAGRNSAKAAGRESSNREQRNAQTRADFEDRRLFGAETVESIDINCVSEDLTFYPSSGEIQVAFKIETVGPRKDNHPQLEISETGGKLEISIRQPEKYGNFIRNIGSYKGVLEIGLPEKKFRSISLHSVSGDVDFQLPVSVEQLSAETVSGNLDGLTFKGTEIRLSTTSGDLSLEDIETDKLAVKTVSGEINGKNLKCKSSDFETVSGDLRFDEMESERTQFHSVSGDFSCQSLIGKRHVFQTMSGDAEIDDLTGEEEFHSMSGDLSIKRRGSGSNPGQSEENESEIEKPTVETR